MKTFIEIVDFKSGVVTKVIDVSGRNTMMVDAALVRVAKDIPDNHYTRIIWQ